MWRPPPFTWAQVLSLFLHPPSLRMADTTRLPFAFRQAACDNTAPATCYVSTTGSDAVDGALASSPLKTIQMPGIFAPLFTPLGTMEQLAPPLRQCATLTELRVWHTTSDARSLVVTSRLRTPPMLSQSPRESRLAASFPTWRHTRAPPKASMSGEA